MSHGGDDEIQEEHEEHVNHEAWVIPYADLLTLLMAMFIALFAMSTVDISKFKALAVGFNEALGGGKLDAGIGGTADDSSPAFGEGNGKGPLTGGTTLQPPQGVPSGTSLAKVLEGLAAEAQKNNNKAQEHATLEDVKNAIEQKAAQEGFASKLRISVRNNGLLVTLVTDKVLFTSGQFELRPESFALLNLISEALKAVDNPLQITGYTDTVPFNGPHGNDVLSFERALAVKDYLVGTGIPDSRMKFPVGAGPRDPIATNATNAGRQMNRRVEILVQSKLVDQTLKDSGLDSKASPPTTSPISSPVDGINPGLSPPIG